MKIPGIIYAGLSIGLVLLVFSRPMRLASTVVKQKLLIVSKTNEGTRICSKWLKRFEVKT